MTARRLLLLPILLLVTGGWECGPSYTIDPGFEVWCDDTLCYWDVEAGLVEPTSTWHEGDKGARLSGGAVISQYLPLSSSESTCLTITVVAAQKTEGQLRFELDFVDDGSAEVGIDIDFDHSFSDQRFEQRTPSWFEGIRVRIHQKGEPVTIARLRIAPGEHCDGLPIPSLDNRPLGASCESADQCESGLCTNVALPLGKERRCSTCDEGQACPGEEICGVDFNEYHDAYYGCGDEGRSQSGAFCSDDLQCAEGYCCRSICSACCTDAHCGGGASCAPPLLDALDAAAVEDIAAILPQICGPDDHARPPGDACNRDENCASGSCVGSPWKRCLLSSTPCSESDDCLLVCLDLGLYEAFCE